MYIPLSFMGGTGVVASCNCTTLSFDILAGSGQYLDLTYQPCNAEQIQTIRYTGNSTENKVCIGELNYNFSGPGVVNYSYLDGPCLQSNCQSCDCYEFFYQATFAASDTYIQYVPCNVPSSSVATIGPLAAGVSGSIICSFPWTIRVINNSLTIGGIVKQVDSASCQPNIVSGSVQGGDLKGGGVVLYVTGSYPNQNGLIVTTESVATSSANMNRWGFYGTITGINNRAYGAGASNTAALRNFTPATGSIAANALTASINGYSDWYLPSKDEMNQIVINKDIIGSGYAREYFGVGDKTWAEFKN
jgi:hypothetical protein